MIITKQKTRTLKTIFVDNEPHQYIDEIPHYEAEQKLEGLFYTGKGETRIEAIENCLQKIKDEEYDDKYSCEECHDTGTVEEIGGESVDVIGYKKCKCGLLDD